MTERQFGVGDTVWVRATVLEHDEGAEPKLEFWCANFVHDTYMPSRLIRSADQNTGEPYP